jgi:hypothetical protein
MKSLSVILFLFLNTLVFSQENIKDLISFSDTSKIKNSIDTLFVTSIENYYGNDTLHNQNVLDDKIIRFFSNENLIVFGDKFNYGSENYFLIFEYELIFEKEIVKMYRDSKSDYTFSICYDVSDGNNKIKKVFKERREGFNQKGEPIDLVFIYNK